MKALSLRQPWAHLVLHHGKRIENRRWKPWLRGEFLIHAAKSMTDDEFDSACDMLDDVYGLQPTLDRKLLQFGGIVGVARLVDVIPPRPEYMTEGLERHYAQWPDIQWRWHMPEQFGFVLTNVRPVAFVPLRGALGFFDVPEQIAALAVGDVEKQRSATTSPEGESGRNGS